MTTSIVYQRTFFADLDGKPLDSGLAYIGVYNQDPEVNPIQAYWDNALTIPATQPLSVSSGYIINNGIRAAVYVNADSYSLRVRNRLGSQVDYVPDANDGRLRVDLASQTGSSFVGFRQNGVGAINQTAQDALWHHAIHLKDFFTGTLSTTSDITSALQLAINAASARVSAIGGIAKVIIPAGYYFQLSATITIPAGVIVEGNGKVNTYLRRTGNYGDTFVVGAANPATNVQCSGIRDMTIFHDHGGGTLPSTNPASWTNSITGTPGHIVAYTPVGCIFENLNLYCLSFGIVCQGGSQSIFRNIDTYGVWDDGNANMQEGLAGFLMAGDTAVTGSIPTWHTIEFCRFGGMTRAGSTVTYYGGNSKTTVKNIGSINGIVIWMAEAVVIDKCYTGACNSNGILISSKSTDIIAGVFITDHFFDPCGVKYQDAGLKFENRDLGGVVDGVTLSNPQFKGQQNGWRAISDWGSTANVGSVKDLIVEGGHASIFVGNPVELYNARRARIEMNIAAYNCENWYGVGSTEASGVHIATACSNIVIGGSLGGGIYGEVAAGANNRCIDGVRADDYVNSRVTVTAANAGMSGSLFVGPPNPVSISTLDADFTLTVGGSSPTIKHTGTLTANRAVTLSTTNAVNGSTFKVARSGGGAFNLTVSGKALTTGQWVIFQYDGSAWQETGFGSL